MFIGWVWDPKESGDWPQAEEGSFILDELASFARDVTEGHPCSFSCSHDGSFLWIYYVYFMGYALEITIGSSKIYCV